MKNKIIIIFLSLILIFACSGITYGIESYDNLGGSNFDFEESTRGYWGADISNYAYVTGSVALSKNAVYPPLISDLDNDDTNEIIVIDDNVVKLYQGEFLTSGGSFILNGGTGYLYNSNPLLYDIDGDNITEIIIFEGNSVKQVQIIEWNGTELINQTRFPVATSGGTGTTGATYSLGCIDTNDCLLTYNSKRVGQVSTAMTMYAIGFNSTGGVTNELSLNTFTNPVSNNDEQVYCLSKYNYIPTANILGNDRYIAVYSKLGGTVIDDDVLYINTLYSNKTDIIKEDQVTRSFEAWTDITGASVGANCQANNLGRYFSNALGSDFTNEYPFDEIVISVNKNPDEFKLYMYDGSLTLRDTHPAIQDGQGTLISNVFVGNYFRYGTNAGSGNDDYCVLGYEQTTDTLELVCGSQKHYDDLLLHTIDFDYDLSDGDYGSITDGYGYINNLVHSVNVDQTTDVINPDEILTSFGTFKLQFSGTDSLFGLFENDYQDSAVIPLDNLGKSSFDLIMLQNTSSTNNNLIYYNDGFSNYGAIIDLDSVTINPSWEYTWKINGTVLINYNAYDIESDSVQYEAYLYYGDDNQQYQNSSFLPSATTTSFTFQINQTISNGIILLRARDSANLDTWDNLTYTFSVANDGISYGDGYIFHGESINATESDIASGDLTDGDKAEVRNAILGNGLVDEKYSVLIGFLILIVSIIVIALLLTKEGMQGTSVFYISGFAGICIWILLVMISMLPAWTLLLGVMFTLILGGIKIANKYASGGE